MPTTDDTTPNPATPTPAPAAPAGVNPDLDALAGSAALWLGEANGAIDTLTAERDRLASDLVRYRNPSNGDTQAQAAAWVAVWRECERLGILKFFDPKATCGRERVLAFLRDLAGQVVRLRTVVEEAAAHIDFTGKALASHKLSGAGEHKTMAAYLRAKLDPAA